MATKYKYEFPITRYSSAITIIGVETPMESAKDNALWAYNSSRAHDGLPPIKYLPKGTKVTRLSDATS